jgi:hypothetical protein
MAQTPPPKKKKKKKKPSGPLSFKKPTPAGEEFQPYLQAKDKLDWRYMPEHTQASRVFVRPPNAVKPVSWRPDHFCKTSSPKPPIIDYGLAPGGASASPRVTNLRLMGQKMVRLFRGIKK